MSSTPNDCQGPQLSGLESRLHNLFHSHHRQVEKVNARRKTIVTISVVLILMSSFCLFSLTSLFFQLDAQALTQIGRLEVEKALPEGRRTLAQSLKQEAPNLVREALLHLVDRMLPEARRHVETSLDERLLPLTAEYEQRFAEQMTATIRSSRDDLDRAQLEGSDSDKLALLFELTADEFNRGVKSALDIVYPQYKAEIDRVGSYLGGLSSTDDDKLTRRERTHKELIQTFLRLVVMENQGKT
jgi:hypothetical protein